MELTEKEIEELHQFVENKSIKFYDLQIELVDHLADDIENILSKDANLSFDQAKKIAYQKFGVFGFSDILKEKEKHLGNKYLKLVFQFIKEWFKLPRILASIGLVYLFYTLLFLDFSVIALYTIQVSICVVLFYKLFTFKKRLKSKTSQKNWMFETIIYQSSLGLFLIIISNLLNIYHSSFFDNTPSTTLISNIQKIKILVISLLHTLEIISFVIIVFIIPKKSQEILKEMYPDYQSA